MTIAVLLLLLSAAPQSGGAASLPAEALGAPPKADESPTAWACTVETLRAGKECVFEAEVSSTRSTDVKAQEASNVRTLVDIGRTLCAKSARTASEAPVDPALVALCTRRFTDTAELWCGLEGSGPVIDAKGRFAPGARACYRGLSEVLQDTSLKAAVASACCQCAEQRGCPVRGESCLDGVAEQRVAGAALACLMDKCGDACGLVAPVSQGEKSRP
jgi:hypothetical protein